MIYPLDASTVQIALTFDRVGSSLSYETPTSTGMERRHRRPALQRAERRPQRTRQGTRYAGHPPALTAARHRKGSELPHYPFRYLEKSNAVGRPVRGAPPCALHRHVRDDLNNQRKGHGEPRPPQLPLRRLAGDWNWQIGASCRTADPRVFFACEDENRSIRRDREHAAKRLCLHCPDQVECRRYAPPTARRSGCGAARPSPNGDTFNSRRPRRAGSELRFEYCRGIALLGIESSSENRQTACGRAPSHA